MSLSEQEIVVQSGPLKELARELCIKADIPTDHAQLIADLQVETDGGYIPMVHVPYLDIYDRFLMVI